MTRGVKPNLPSILCELCGVSFTKKTEHQRFCSRKCEQKNISIINPVSHRKAYKNWINKKLKKEPSFYSNEYLKRKNRNYEKFREQRNGYARKDYQRLRNLALSEYGNKCACCNEDRVEFLAIDHINGGGYKHRKELKGKMSIYRWLYKNNYPKEFRILCHNCNCALGFYGYCPHTKI